PTAATAPGLPTWWAAASPVPSVRSGLRRPSVPTPSPEPVGSPWRSPLSGRPAGGRTGRRPGFGGGPGPSPLPAGQLSRAADADDDLSEQNVAELVKCIRLCLDCADVCTA